MYLNASVLNKNLLMLMTFKVFECFLLSVRIHYELHPDII